jgi:purine catabolism regulator
MSFGKRGPGKTAPGADGKERAMKSAAKKFTRQSLVELSSFGGYRILNSRCSMGQEILRATVVEDTNLGRWAQPGDAVICSGYPFHTCMDRFYDALEQLHASGAVVLCIKAVRNKPFPEDAIELADRLDLLVVELPREAIFSTIIQEISEKILSLKAELFSQLQAQTESLLEILFRENVLEDCFLRIEQFIGNPIIAFVPGSKLYMSRETRDWLSEEDLIAVFNMFCRQSQTGEMALPVLIGGRNTVFEFIEIRMTGNETLLLGIAEWNQSTDELVFFALKRIGKFLAVEVKNATTVEKVQRRQEDTLINDLFSGEFASDSDVVAAAASYNYHLDRSWKYRIAIVRLLKRPDSPPINVNFSSLLQSAREYLNLNAILTSRGEEIVLMFCDGSETTVLDRFVKWFSGIVSGYDLQAHLSEPASLVGIPVARDQAHKIGSICQRCDITDKTVTIERLGTLWLLNLLPRDVTVTNFVHRFLAPLITYDLEHGSSLLRTLEAYLDCNSNTKLTSQILYTHYNTVTYRLGKIQTLLGVSLEDNEVRLQLQVALKLYRLFAQSSDAP